MADEKKLRILIEAILDERGFKKAKDSLKGVKDGAEKTGKSLDKVKTSSKSFLDTFSKAALVVTGAMTPIIRSAQSYVSTVQMADETSRAWLATSYQIEQTQLRIGKVAAEKLVPYYSILGDIFEKFGGFTEENPAAGLGTMAGVGVATALGIKAILKGLLGQVVPGAAGGTAVAGGTAAAGGTAVASGATVATIAGVVAAGVTLGLVGADQLSKTDFNIAGRKPASLDKTLVVAAGLLGNLTSIMETWFTGGIGFAGKELPANMRGAQWAGKLLGVKSEAEESLDRKKKYETIEFIKAQYEFRKQETHAQDDHNRRRRYMEDDFHRKQLYAEQDYERQRGISFRNFAMQQAQSEKMFYMQRAIAQRDFQISVRRTEYDYQLSRKRAQEDYNFSLKQIMLSGDALAYYYAERQFKIDQQRAEEDYQLQKRRSAEDFNRSMADSLMFFGVQRAFAQKMFNISMADQEIQYDITRKRARWEFENVTMKRMEVEYKIMANRRLAAFYEHIAPTIVKIDNLRLMYQQSFLDTAINGYIGAAQAMEDYFHDMASFYGGTGGGGELQQQFGGYTKERRYKLHDHEFVLNPATTYHAEQAAQGRLTQEKVVNMLTGGSGGLVYNDSRQFSRGLSIEEKTMLRQELRQIVVEVFR